MLGAAAPAQAGVDDFTFESLDVQYYLDRDDAGHSTLRTVETFVALFPDFDQNKGLVRNIPSTYGGTDAFDRASRRHPAAHRERHRRERRPGLLGDLRRRKRHLRHVHRRRHLQARTPHLRHRIHPARRHPALRRHRCRRVLLGHQRHRLAAAVRQGVGHGPPRRRPCRQRSNGNAACYRGEYGSDATCPIEVDGEHRLASARTRSAATRTCRWRSASTSGTFTPGQTIEQHPIVRILPWVLLGVLALIAVAIVILRRTRWAHAPGRGIVVPQYEGPDDSRRDAGRRVPRARRTAASPPSS